MEIHKTQRIGWLRASVLGANDGIVSTASLLVGVAAAGGFDTLMVTGVAAMVANPQAEQRELSTIYEKRGLTPQLAQQVAEQLMAHDALAAHARDELGLSPELSARPLQAALASAASFAVGAALPLLVVALSPPQLVIAGLSVTAITFLALLGGVAARAGGANLWPSVLRVTFWGALAMAVTAGVGAWFGAAV